MESVDFEPLAQQAYLSSVLVPAIQPIVCMATGEVSHYEMLARVNEKSPWSGHGDLVSSAERYGFIDRVDLAMLDFALRIVETTDVSVAINVSPHTIEARGAAFIDRLSATRAFARRVVVEITEVRPFSRRGVAEEFAAAVRASGARIALDDYGSEAGYIDVATVESLRPELLKFDRVLVEAGLAGDSTFEEALSVAGRSGCAIVGEHIDSAEKALLLQRRGIGYGQGWLFGKAVPFPEWLEYVTVQGSWETVSGIVAPCDGTMACI